MTTTLEFPFTVDSALQQFTPIIRQIAARFAQPRVGAEFEDLFSIGSAALVRAVDRVAPEATVPEVEAFLRVKVRGAIVDAVRSAAPISRRRMELRRKYVSTVEKLEAELLREPTDEELAARLCVSLDRLRIIQRAITPRRCASIQADQADEDGDKKSLDQEIWEAFERSPFSEDAGAAHPAARIEAHEKALAMKSRVDALPKLEATILHASFTEGRGLREIAAKLGLSSARICQLRKKAIESLRVSLEEKCL